MSFVPPLTSPKEAFRKRKEVDPDELNDERHDVAFFPILIDEGQLWTPSSRSPFLLLLRLSCRQRPLTMVGYLYQQFSRPSLPASTGDPPLDNRPTQLISPRQV